MSKIFGNNLTNPNICDFEIKISIKSKRKDLSPWDTPKIKIFYFSYFRFKKRF